MRNYLILGAGPAGLAFANRLLQNGEENFLVLEAEKEAGGLCRSSTVDGAPLDIGGGHFLDVRRPEVNRFLFGFMGEGEWNRFSRDSRIDVKGTLISHPFEANIWQMNIEDQVRYLKSIAIAGCNTGQEEPRDFVSWISWKLGERIASDYMIPYNQKIFGEELSQLGTYWLEKLPNVSFEETLRSCLERQAYGEQPGHAQFYYPKRHGFGELWLRMARALGDRVEYGRRASALDFEKREVRTADGNAYRANAIVTTIPWAAWARLKGMPAPLKESIAALRHSSIQVRYRDRGLKTGAHWIYCPDPELSYHRILVRHNFCPGSRGHWTETNASRFSMEKGEKGFTFLNEYAYPLNTAGKPEIMGNLLNWCMERGVYGLGRWGEHQHYNSDAAVERAIRLADNLEGRDKPITSA